MAVKSHIIRFSGPDGITLVADVVGDPSQPAVVLMHGGGQTRHSWSGALRAFADRGYYVINYDARGHGDSDWSADGEYRLEARALDLLAVIGHIEGPFALVGASMGGATAMQAISGGLTPNALVLVDIVPRPNLRGVQRIVSFMLGHQDGFATLQEAADAIAAYNPDRARPPSPDGLLKNLRRDESGRYHWHWDPRMLHGPARDPEALARTIEGKDWGSVVPTLLVRGMHSDIVTDASVEDFRRHVPSLEVHNVSDAGHMVAGDKNDVFNAGVIAYLEKRMPPGT